MNENLREEISFPFEDSRITLWLPRKNIGAAWEITKRLMEIYFDETPKCLQNSVTRKEE